jgi:hypothetical protein
MSRCLVVRLRRLGRAQILWGLRGLGFLRSLGRLRDFRFLRSRRCLWRLRRVRLLLRLLSLRRCRWRLGGLGGRRRPGRRGRSRGSGSGAPRRGLRGRRVPRAAGGDGPRDGARGAGRTRGAGRRGSAHRRRRRVRRPRCRRPVTRVTDDGRRGHDDLLCGCRAGMGRAGPHRREVRRARVEQQGHRRRAEEQRDHRRRNAPGDGPQSDPFVAIVGRHGLSPPLPGRASPGLRPEIQETRSDGNPETDPTFAVSGGIMATIPPR